MSRTELKEEFVKVKSEYLNLKCKLERLQSELERCKPEVWEAEEGETVKDGSILAFKSEGIALLVAPANTEICHSWCPHLVSRPGLDPSSQWFIPDIDTLVKVMEKIPDAFSKEMRYWSSTCHFHSDWGSSLDCAYHASLSWDNKAHKKFDSCSTELLVRAFRTILY